MSDTLQQLIQARGALEEIIDNDENLPDEYINAVVRIQGGLEALEGVLDGYSTDIYKDWLHQAHGYINAYSPDGFEVPYE